jgi:site-specific recombinase XerD
MNSFTFTQTVEGYLLAANARRLSENTLRDYQITFRKFFNFLDEDPPINEITPEQVKSFLVSQNGVSKKTLLNYHIGLSALWTWAVKEELVQEHVIQKVDRPKPEKKDIRPYSHAEVKAMLDVISHSKLYSRPGKRECSHALPHVDRNRAMIYLLLDTGVRVSELGNLRLNNIDFRNRRITVMGKGSKQRTIPFSPRTGQVLWRYLAQRKDSTADEFLFVTNEGRMLTRSRILNILRTLGSRAGVNGVNVHRFRHTFAINFLRNGGDPFSLQRLLGHSSMEMVLRHLSIA